MILFIGNCAADLSAAFFKSFKSYLYIYGRPYVPCYQILTAARPLRPSVSLHSVIFLLHPWYKRRKVPRAEETRTRIDHIGNSVYRMNRRHTGCIC